MVNGLLLLVDAGTCEAVLWAFRLAEYHTTGMNTPGEGPFAICLLSSLPTAELLPSRLHGHSRLFPGHQF